MVQAKSVSKEKQCTKGVICVCVECFHMIIFYLQNWFLFFIEIIFIFTINRCTAGNHKNYIKIYNKCVMQKMNIYLHGIIVCALCAI